MSEPNAPDFYMSNKTDFAFETSDGDLSLCMSRLFLSMKAGEVFFVLVLIEGCSNENALLFLFNQLIYFCLNWACSSLQNHLDNTASNTICCSLCVRLVHKM